MSKKLQLDRLDVYSTEVERVANAIKRVIRFSDTEEKLFGWFDWYRNMAAHKDKSQWDRCFSHFLNREMGRTHISQDFATKLRARLDTDIEQFRGQHSVEGLIPNPVAEISAPTKLDEHVKVIREASQVEEYTEYADLVKAGHDEALSLGRILDSLWKHREKMEPVLNNPVGDKSLTDIQNRDRNIDFARYLDSRTKRFKIEEDQDVLKAILDEPSSKEKPKKPKKYSKKSTQKMAEAGADDATEEI